jgi:Ca2+-binding RTX toxin-like protein
MLFAGSGQYQGLAAVGGDGNDTLVDTGSGTLDAGPGDDVLWQVGAKGLAILQGGDGNDQLFVGTGTGSADCGAGNDVAYLTAAAQAADARHQLDRRRIGFAGCESIQPAPAGAEAPTFGGQADRYKALGVPWDDDVVARDLAYEQMDSCQRKNAACPGTDNAERIIGTNGNDHINGQGGDDFLEGANGNDDLVGGRGRDSLFGRIGDDHLDGGLGGDEIEGGRGDDTIIGGDGSDEINGGLGRDKIFAGPGNDTIRAVGGGTDVVDCGPGRDRVEKDSRDRVRNCEIVL